MKRLFICSTYLHMINTINLITNNLKNDEVENILFITDNSDNYKDIILLANISGLFTEIKLIEVKELIYKYSKPISKINGYFNYKYIVKNILKDYKEYIFNEFYFSFMDFPIWLIFMYFKKLNKNIKLYSLSDGVGGYNLLTTKENKINKIILHLLGFNTMFEELKKLYIYKKELVTNYYDDILVENLNIIDNTNKTYFILKKFNMQKRLSFKLNKFIFLESPFSNDELNKKQLQTIKFINEIIKDNFCIKKHPRHSIINSNNNECTINKNIAMENIYIELGNILEKNVFISGISAASVLPKLMFNKEPYIIFLYKLWNMQYITYNDSNYLKFLEKFTLTYSNKNKVFIPTSFEELKEILLQIYKGRL